MGRDGIAFTFVTADEGQQLTAIELNINRLLTRDSLNPDELKEPSRAMQSAATIAAGPATETDANGDAVAEAPKKRRLFPLRRKASRK